MLQVLANDDVQPSDAGQLKVEDIIQSPNKGGVVVLNSGAVIYTPNAGTSGGASFMRLVGGVTRKRPRSASWKERTHCISPMMILKWL